MSSADFQKVLVKDDRIGNITDSVKYSVLKGGQTITPTPFQAISAGTSSCTFNIQVPSQETLIDRRLLWRSTFSLNVSITNNTGLNITEVNAVAIAGMSAADWQAFTTGMLGYGGNTYQVSDGVSTITVERFAALAPFPQHELMSTMTATINNSSVSINIRDVLPQLLRFNDKRQIMQYNSYAPVMWDIYGNYLDARNKNNNPLGAWGNSSDYDLTPRGAWVLDSVVCNTAQGTINNNATLNYTITITTTEPLLLSPLIFCNPLYSNQAFYGIQVMNFVFNVGSASRVWRDDTPVGSVDTFSFGSCSFNGFTKSELLFTFITPHPSDLLPARNIVPYYELPRYISNVDSAIAAPADRNATVQLSTQTLQLNQIPDKLILCVRKQMTRQTNTDPDCFLPIRGVSINFNTNAGILSSASTQDLYRMSVDAGSNQSWQEFYGYASQGQNNLSRTSGSLLILDFGTAIQLIDDFYAAGSLGNFNLQIQLYVHNNTGAQIDANTYEICLMTMNSGVFVCERGTSQVFTGILNKSDVLDASAGEVYTRSDVQRLVGGGFFDSLRSIAGRIKDVVSPIARTLAPIAKVALGSMPDPRAQAASAALGALGAGQSGGRRKALKDKFDERIG